MFAIKSISASPKISLDRGGNSNDVIKRLQDKQKIFETGSARFLACDAGAQEVLKLIKNDADLWRNIQEKLEVRVIKATGDGSIVLHPADDVQERWSGKYHIYITVRHEDRRLVIDPYVGGKNSCAHVDEQEFIRSNWKGVAMGPEGYTVETVAPTNELDQNGNYVPAFSIEDYMYDFFDPHTYESHKFFYD